MASPGTTRAPLASTTTPAVGAGAAAGAGGAAVGAGTGTAVGAEVGAKTTVAPVATTLAIAVPE